MFFFPNVSPGVVESSLPFSSDPLETIAKSRRAIAPLLGNALRNRCRAIASAIHLHMMIIMAITRDRVFVSDARTHQGKSL